MTSKNENWVQGGDGVVLVGLDGANPLGFLAALGTLRVLSLKYDNARMSWSLSEGTWRPTYFCNSLTESQLGTVLHSLITKLDKCTWSFDKKLPFSSQRLRDEASKAVANASITSRHTVDEIASLGVSCSPADEDFEGTALCMVRSGDSTGQGLLAYGKRILESTSAEQLQKAILSEWLYTDEQCALRWDPAEDRGYALQWRNPSKVGALSIKGANCLALLAMRLFPVLPTKGRAETVGFGLKRARQSSFTWPIWGYPVTLNVITSLIELPELQHEFPPGISLEMRGIVAVYRSDRVMTSTYYANFTPARRVA